MYISTYKHRKMNEKQRMNFHCLWNANSPSILECAVHISIVCLHFVKNHYIFKCYIPNFNIFIGGAFPNLFTQPVSHCWLCTYELWACVILLWWKTTRNLQVVEVKLDIGKCMSLLPDIDQKWFCTWHEHMDVNFQVN